MTTTTLITPTAETVKALRVDLEDAKLRFYAGAMTYDECKAAACRAAKAINEYGAAKAKAAGMRWKPVSATGLMR